MSRGEQSTTSIVLELPKFTFRTLVVGQKREGWRGGEGGDRVVTQPYLDLERIVVLVAAQYVSQSEEVLGCGSLHRGGLVDREPPLCGLLVESDSVISSWGARARQY